MLTKRKVCSLVRPGDAVFIIAAGGGVIPAKVNEICDDCIETDQDTLFYDEHRIVWMFTESEAKKMALKSQKNVLY